MRAIPQKDADALAQTVKFGTALAFPCLMKILYSHRTKSADGQYVHIRALTDALIGQGAELCLVGPEGVSDRAVRALDAAPGAPEKATGQWKIPGPIYELAEYGYSAPAFRRLGKACAAFGPDIIYERYNLYFHAGLWLKRRTGLPLILEVNAPLREERLRHGGLALPQLAQYSEQALWRAADAVLPVTQVLADKVVAAGVDPARIEVIQNGVHDDFLTPRDGDKIRHRYQLGGKTVLGFTGFVRDWHGVDRVLAFMAREKNPNLHLLLVGDGPARDVLERQAISLNLQDQFSVTGIVQREDIADHVAAFDIALQPAVVEYASPLKLFEYMALGKAIIAPSTNNICEVLTHNEDGYLFSPNDQEMFFEGLKRLSSDGNLRTQLGKAALATLERDGYKWDRNAQRVEAIAQRLIEDNK